MTNVKMILDEVNARIKLAEAKTAEDPSNFDSFPGAEHDAPVSADKAKPDPEVKDEGPASRTEATGAEPGSDAKILQDGLYEADEPVLTPEKKPAVSSNADAKTASANPDTTKLAESILSTIHNKLSSAEKTAAAGNKETDVKTAAVKRLAALLSKSAAEKKAREDKMSLETRILDKIASTRMAKQAGANVATSLLKQAADYNQGAADAEAAIVKLAQALEEAAAAEAAPDAAGAEGAAVPVSDAEAAGAADAEAALADAAGAEGADTGDAAEAAGAADAEAALADAAGAEGAEDADAGDDITPEDVVQAVQELNEEGQISDEEAATVLTQLLGADEEAADEEQLAEGIANAVESGELSEEDAQALVAALTEEGADPELAEAVANGGDEGADAADDPAVEAGAADAAEAIDAAQKEAEAHDIERYQRGFINKCAEFGADPQAVAAYLQGRIAGVK